MSRNRFLYALVVLLCSSLLLAGEAYAGEPEIAAEAAVLLDLDSGCFLYEKNPDQQMYPASTTKVLTALLAVKNGNLRDRVTMSENAVYAGGAAIWSTPGEQFTFQDLLWALMLSSANDAATALAEHLAGSVEDFAVLMNAEAKRLGAHNSHFVNPHGLHDDRHYSTARDLAVIARAAWEKPLIRKMAATKTYRLSREDPEALSLLVNTNKLLWRYESAVGLKTGYTSEAGQCLIAVAEREGRTLLAVVLKSDNDLVWTDAATLLNYGFERFRAVDLVSEGDLVCAVPVVHGEDKVLLRAGSGLTHIVPVDQPGPVRWEVRLEREMVAPIRRDETVGVLVVYHAGEEIGQVPLLVEENVNRPVRTTWWYRVGLVLGGLVVFTGGLRFVIRRRRRSWYYRGRR
jgi:D-alanyl-D-alanine carboxypeptidase (penicillin-binding protein 5/6)